MEVIVNNINKMGVLSHVRLNKKDVENHEDSPMIIMLPRGTLMNQPEILMIDSWTKD